MSIPANLYLAVNYLAKPPADISGVGAGAPPGSAGFTTMLGWVLWGGFIICVAAVVAAGAKLAFGSSGGGQNNGTQHLGWAVAGSVVTGSAAAIVSAVT